MNNCASCDTDKHCDGLGTYQEMDQDGLNHYVCQCFCGYSRKEREAAEYALSPLIGRYGKKVLLEILNKQKR